MRRLLLFSGLIVLLSSAFTTQSNSTIETAAGPWRFIADRTVDFGVDHDVILFGNLADGFRQLKLIVTDGPLKVYDMKVYFDNGDVQDVAIRKHIRQGGQTRVIDLVGGLRHLKKIEFWYETKGFIRGRSRVAVWGKI